MRSSWRWFSAKTVYRVESQGEPYALDADYEADSTLVEERVVLFRARSHEEAMRKAEEEAGRYAGAEYINPYGQRVVWRALSPVETYELDDSPGAGVEVWSSMTVRPASVSDEEVEARCFGPEGDCAKRRKFMNREFSGGVYRAE